MNSFRSTLALTLALSAGLAAQGQTADRSKTFNYGATGASRISI